MNEYKETWHGIASEETSNALLVKTSALLVETLANNAAAVAASAMVTSGETFARPNNSIDYLLDDSIGQYVANVAQVDEVVLTGTSGTANIFIAGITLPFLATFDTDIGQTVINFESAHVLTLAAAGITLTRDLETLVFTATTAGVPFGAITIIPVTGDLAGETLQTTANTTLAAIEIPNCSNTGNGTAILRSISIETEMMGLGSEPIYVWLYSGKPNVITGDGEPFATAWEDRNLRTGSGMLYLRMSNAIGASTSVHSTTTENMLIQTDENKSLWILISTNVAVAAPLASAKFSILITTSDRT